MSTKFVYDIHLKEEGAVMPLKTIINYIRTMTVPPEGVETV